MTASQAPRFAVRELAVGSIGPVHFELAAGACLALSGPSGAGKTRLLRAMADLDAHDGECFLDGEASAHIDAPHWRARVGFLAAESAWWADTPAAHMRNSGPGLDVRLATVDLSAKLLTQPLARLSSGQRQRLALLRVLDREPDVLLLDEPTANLDAANVARVETLIGDYCRRHGACAVWVAHDPAQLARVAQRHLTIDAAGQMLTCT